MFFARSEYRFTVVSIFQSHGIAEITVEIVGTTVTIAASTTVADREIATIAVIEILAAKISIIQQNATEKGPILRQTRIIQTTSVIITAIFTTNFIIPAITSRIQNAGNFFTGVATILVALADTIQIIQNRKTQAHKNINLFHTLI